MADTPQRLQNQAEQYARLRKLLLIDKLGGGVNGSVWYTNIHSAVKAFELAEAYERERDAYLRLTQFDVTYVNEFAVPGLRGFDNDLLVIELETVSPPYVLDFAGAYLDHPPDYTPEALAEHESRNAELFGVRWPRVRLLLAKLLSMGIHYVDINRGNIRFPEFDEKEDEPGTSSPQP